MDIEEVHMRAPDYRVECHVPYWQRSEEGIPMQAMSVAVSASNENIIEHPVTTKEAVLMWSPRKVEKIWVTADQDNTAPITVWEKGKRKRHIEPGATEEFTVEDASLMRIQSDVEGQKVFWMMQDA